MCGIAGIAGVFGREAGRRKIQRMVAALVRRGPDAEGFAEFPGAVLGHRRLAIFDLTQAGAQPMSTDDGEVAVVFNGAIYNFKALRALLEKTGCRFRSESDTEVLLHGYRAWGIVSLARRLRGMFAFGLWDNSARKLYLVRDRLGVKPLVFADRGKEIAFASTVRALARGGYGGGIHEGAVLDLLRWGFVGEQQCIYHGLSKLPAATILEWSDGAQRQYCYWQPPRPHSSALSFRDAMSEVERRLRDAVAVRLAADVPVAVLLSGGVDSSLICWAVAELGADLTAYTVGVPGDPWDESRQAVATAHRLGIRHRVVPLGDSQVPDFDELLSAYDEPFPSSSALGMLGISRVIGSSAKVLLTGDGGDDLFLGYPRHRHLWVAERLARCLPSGAFAAWNRWGRRATSAGPLRRAGALLDYADAGVEAFVRKSTGLSGYRARGLLGPRLQDAAPSSLGSQVDPCRGMVETLVELERGGRFIGEYLKKVDGATMYHGLEARAPFLDQDLWEFGCALPVDLRLRRGELKAILRALARQRIGMDVAARKKRGFRIPAQRWLAGHWFERAEEALTHSMLARDGWIDGENALAELRASAERGRASDELWNLFVIESWLRHEEAQVRREPACSWHLPAHAQMLQEGPC